MSAPAPHSLTVGELSAMLAGLDGAAFSNAVGLRRKAGKIVQFEIEILDPKKEAEDTLRDLRDEIFREERKQIEIRMDVRKAEKQLARLKRALAGIAKLRAAKVLHLP